MNLNLKPITYSIFIFFLSLSLTTTALSQNTLATGPDLEATLYILIDGQGSGAIRMPEHLAAVRKQIEREHAVGNLRLAGTFSGRAAQGGQIDARSISQISSETSSEFNTVNWGLQALRSNDDAVRPGMATARAFRLTIRVPIPATVYDEQKGQARPVTLSDQVYLNISELNIANDRPTLLGSVALSDSNRVMFVVLNVREAK